MTTVTTSTQVASGQVGRRKPTMSWPWRSRATAAKRSKTMVFGLGRCTNRASRTDHQIIANAGGTPTGHLAAAPLGNSTIQSRIPRKSDST